MSDQRSDAPLATGAEWLARFLSKRGMGACICEGQEIHAAVSEIDHLRAALKRANDQAEHFEREWYLRGDENEKLRAALVAAMEIVQKERTRIAYNAKGAPPAIYEGYAGIMRRLDAIIAQADVVLKYNERKEK